MDPWLLVVPLLLAPLVLLLACAGCDVVFGLYEIPVPKDPYGDAILAEPGLVSFWRFDDAAGTFTAVDSGPSALNGACSPDVVLGVPGALQGPSYVYDAAQPEPLPALTLGANFRAGGMVTVGSDLRLHPPMAFSAELWVKFGENGMYLTLMASLVPGGAGFALGAAGTARATTINALVQVDGSHQLMVAAATPVDATTERWHHVVLTYDPGVSAQETLTLYVDGVAEPALGGGSTYAPATGADFVIGSDGVHLAAFVGQLDEVAFYNVALDADAVSAHLAAASS